MSKIRQIIFILCSWVILAGNAFAVAPENGWWWNPTESGSGYAIERQGNSLFMAAFLYETTGAATWYATGLTLQPDGSYKGDMTRYLGGKSLLGPYKAPTSTSVVATATLAFTDPFSGVMKITFPNGSPTRTVPITRFAFGSPSFDPSNGTFQNSWWWNDQESGTGYFIEVQGNSAFIASFMYDTAGQPTWYASGANLSGTNILSGPLDMYANGQSLGGTYQAPTANSGGAGFMSYGFSSASVGSMTLPNAAKVAIKRFVFDPTALTNHAPVPSAGSNQTVNVGDTVYLNGSGIDADRDPLTFYWRLLTAPNGSKTSLVDAQTTRPYFVADAAGTYRVLLLADDGKSSNGQSVVTVTANSKTSTNTPPVANAGSDQTVAVGTTVKLSGAASSDVNGDALTYAWFFVTKPVGSSAVLSGATSLSPTFTVDVAGNYLVGLTVSDGKSNSTQSTVSVKASSINLAPVANAGPNQTITIGNAVLLNGTASSDANGDKLTYLWWFISKPTDPSSWWGPYWVEATLSNENSANPSFIPDRLGTYVLGLKVFDGKVYSPTSTVTVTSKAPQANIAPIANAGQNKRVHVGSTVTLDGSLSNDANGDKLTYSWSLSRPNPSKPHDPQSSAVLKDSNSAYPSFITDVIGTYWIGLTVNDGKVSSETAQISVTAENIAPIAVARVETGQSLNIGTNIRLTGDSSSDADGDKLRYRWNMIERPVGSKAVLLTGSAVEWTDSPSQSFIPDSCAPFIIGLMVYDGWTSNLTESKVYVTATAVDPPVANAGKSQTGVVTQTFYLGDNSPTCLSYSWTMTSAPAGSKASLFGKLTATPYINADLPGIYTFSLVVNNGIRNSLPSTVMLIVEPPIKPPTEAPIQLLGGLNYLQNLGCFNCIISDEADSICNINGRFGSTSATNSIWNELGPYGNKDSIYSPWNLFSLSGPLIKAWTGGDYGIFTMNKSQTNRTNKSVFLNMLDFYTATNNLTATRAYACGDHKPP